MKHFKINYLENGEKRHIVIVAETKEEAMDLFVEVTLLKRVQFLNIEVIPFEY